MNDTHFIPVRTTLPTPDERCDDGELLLSLLQKYKRLIEAFDREEIFSLTARNAGHKEDVLDRHLRRFLMASGIEYPFSTPRIVPEETGVVVPGEQAKPLSLAVKLFDGNQYPKSRIRQGFKRAVQYAKDYNGTAGYLVIFNLSDSLIQIGDTSTAGKASSIEWNERVIFFIIINVMPVDRSAGALPHHDVVLIDREYLSESWSECESEREQEKEE